jgi:gluconolactonase
VIQLRARLVPFAGVLLVPLAGGGGSSDAATTPTEPTATIGGAVTGEPTLTGAAASGDPLVGRGEVELVADGDQWTEGPQWVADDGVLLFTDGGVIYQLADDDEISAFGVPIYGANGLALDTEGRLIVAENTMRRVTRVESDGTVTAIAEEFEGVPLNQPNDIVVRSDGTIYFTDPYYGDGTTDLDFHGVFRIAPDGSLNAEYRGAITEQPNGIALSPDESLLYVAESAADLVWVFDVADDGSLSEAETFVTTGVGPDGMTVDNDGNLFVATDEGIEVFAPDAARWGVIPVPTGAKSNCAFGGDDGRTLYITAPPALYRVTLAHPGPSAPPGSGQDAAPPTSG